MPPSGSLHADDRLEAGEIDRVRRRSGGHAGDVQAAGAQRLDLRGVGLGREPAHALAGDLGKVLEEVDEHVLVDGRILDRRVGEDQRRRVLPGLRVLGQVGDEVAVLVAVARVEQPAVGARCLRERGTCRDEGGDEQRGQRRGPAQEDVHPVLPGGQAMEKAGRHVTPAHRPGRRERPSGPAATDGRRDRRNGVRTLPVLAGAGGTDCAPQRRIAAGPSGFRATCR